MMGSVIEFDDICKDYLMGDNCVHALSHVGFNIEKGELVAIVGGSGSGKSTILNILGLLDRPTSGTYRLEGRDVLAYNDENLAAIRNQQIGFIFQQYFLLPRLSALQNVMLPLKYRHLPDTQAKERAHTLLDKFEVGRFAHHKPSQLSGGQQQRVAIARALVGEPAVILADEPTGALDTHTGQEVMNLFLDLHNQGLTIVVVSHDLKIAKQCQRTIKISDGNIVNA